MISCQRCGSTLRHDFGWCRFCDGMTDDERDEALAMHEDAADAERERRAEDD